MKNFFSFLLTILFLNSFAQETQNKIIKTSKLENPFDHKLDLNHQFDYVHKKSSNWQDFKMIKKNLFNTLKTSILDSIQAQKNMIVEKNDIIENNQQQIALLNEDMTITQNKLDDIILQKESRSVLGIQTNKSVFSVVITLSYLFLFTLLGLFIFKYKQNISTTNKAVHNLNSLEIEFEQHKKKSLIRFQEVNRKLQDELNKNWKKEK